jgi:hypothetical protein
MLLCSILGLAAVLSAPPVVSAKSCGYEIQNDCIFQILFERQTKETCEKCAKAHESDLRKAGCKKNEEVEQFCGGVKPVIGGYDVVQYHSLKPTEFGVLGSPEFKANLTSPDLDGSPRFTYEFWFSTAANRDTFAGDPWKYAPKYGGW